MFRILSLDGGGIKGTFTASVLATLEEATGQRCVDHFDLITGTSTGGIIALGLGLGLTAREIAEFYQHEGPEIFPTAGFLQNLLNTGRQMVGPKYNADVLRQKLTEVFGEKLLKHSESRLVIPTYDTVGGRIYLMKTAHHPRFQFDVDISAVEVGLATSAAPTYFESAAVLEHDNTKYIDGGVWANCPALVGVTEAVSFLKKPVDQIDVLSVGTTAEPFSVADYDDAGAAEWAPKLLPLLFTAQAEAALAQASLLVGGNLHRIDVTVEPGRFELGGADPQSITELLNLGRGEAVKKVNLEAVEKRFLNGTPIAPFKPSKP